eukprot:CAMPEP_0116137416 /NCGR_PEP_ID=MMETSP0329-20121206/12236_1 /TAXON_ID=697910 /ORGANISM="Pseudo-nitzschia arenysensis, Strain B593" /LENGTH=795 /DNA_ID=CAMNT_0003632329 /DNA_START=264 /DNA_END=2651 /DNA_ORIENTATION=-
MARQLEPEESSGPIRRRIQSLTIKLEPFETSLTNQEAINVRNAIESLLKDYFFEVQPWAEEEESSTETIEQNSLENNNNSNRNSIHDSSNYRDSESNTAPKGSVTYIGLAQILENKQTEGGVELSMNGLVYFAEGSERIPDEDELLQTMETQALGDSKAMAEALQDFFPQQQQLVVTVKTPFTETPELPIVEEQDNLSSTVVIDVPETVDAPWVDEQVGQLEPSQSNQLVGAPGNSTTSSLNSGVIGGGIAVAVLALVVLVGLFAVRRRRFRKGGDAKEYLVGVMTSSSDDDDVENGFSPRSSLQDDWKVNSNSPPRMQNETEALPRPQNNARFLSKAFQRKSPVAEKHLDMVNSAQTVRKSIPEPTFENPENTDVNMSNFEFTDDGSSDFDDVVSIRPHMLNLQSLESFEEQHTNMTHNEIVVQKDMLGSSFEEAPTNLLGEIDAGELQPPISASSTSATPANKLLLSNTHTGATAASGGDLSYSSSSTSSQINDHLVLLQKNSFGSSVNESPQEGDEQEDQRIRYSMMPNPYVHNKSTVHGRQKAAEAAVMDRSAPCVLQATDFTASSLARKRSKNKDSISEAGSSHSMGMVPKLAAPSWWTEKGNPTKKSSAAAEEAYLTDDLAYSGDEENTFGVAESDGWDPADADLSSMGDAPTQQMMDELDFHMGLVANQTSSTTPTKQNRNQDPPGTYIKKFEEPQGISPMRSTKRVSPPSSNNMQAAKSILQKMKPQNDEVNTSVDSIEAAKSVLQKVKSSPKATGHYQLGESIAAIFESDTSAEEIEFNLDSTMEI